MSSLFRSIFLVFAVWAIAAHGFGQAVKLQGGLFASGTIQPVAGASVHLFSAKDSTVKGIVLTDSAGKFVFNRIPLGSYRLQVEGLGFQPYTQQIRIKDRNRAFSIDSIFLQPNYEALGAVTVAARRPKVVVKTDTTEFSAAAVKVKKNGTVEDVFKKLPGLEVDKNGNVKAQGETVTQIYVDGKPFFGTDLKAVTQNFPADIIEKIQIIDKKSDQALATHVEDGKREKIINITLKKNRKRGVFGTDYIGYGTEQRYEARTNTNMFNNDRKISIVAAANNTGRVDNGSSTDDQSYYNTWNGITDNKQVKLNYADKIGKDFTFSAYGGYDRSSSKREQTINRQNIFADSSSNYFEQSVSKTINSNVYGGLYFEYRPDTLTFIKFNHSAGYAKNNYQYGSLFNSALSSGEKLNEGNRNNNNRSSSPSLNGEVSVNRRFRHSRRNIFFTFNDNIGNSNGRNLNLSDNYFYPVNADKYQQLLNQQQFNKSRSTNLGTGLSYSEPLGENSALNFSYNLNYGQNNTLKETYDFNDSTSAYDLVNDTLSNHFDNKNYNHVAGVTWNYSKKKSGFGLGLRWQNALTRSRSVDSSNVYQQTFSGIAPNLNYFYNTKSTRFNVFYNFSLRAPQATQLQPVVDNSNPLYIKLGNPDLKYASVHNIRYYFNYYNAKKERGFNSNASFSSIVNNIANNNTFNNNTGSQQSQPVNMDGAYNWNAWFSYFQPLFMGKDKLKWSVSLYANGSRNVNLLNGDENVNLNNYEKLFMGIIYDTPSWIDINTNLSISRQEGEYSLQSSLNTTSYYWSINPNIRFNPTSTTEITIDYDYRQTAGQAAGFNTTVNMLNADIVQYFSRKKDVWLKLKGFDLLNQNVNIWRSTGDNYIQDTRANVLSRFLLLSLNVRLNKFAPPPGGSSGSDVPATML
jgi:hypothetical protein